MPISNERSTPSVAWRLQPSAHRARRAAAILALAVSLRPNLARAAEPVVPVSQSAQPPPSAPEPSTSYALPLGLAYAGAPLLAYAFARGAGGAGAVLAGLTFTLPAVVHIYHGETLRGLVALPALAATTFAGAALGLMIGGALSSCDEKADSECVETGIAANLSGAAIGAALGYVTYAIIDVASNSTVPRSANGPDVASMQLWVQPLPTRLGREGVVGGRAVGAAGDVRLTGGMLGISVRF
jgi:hypothetical protein